MIIFIIKGLSLRIQRSELHPLISHCDNFQQQNYVTEFDDQLKLHHFEAKAFHHPSFHLIFKGGANVVLALLPHEG